MDKVLEIKNNLNSLENLGKNISKNNKKFRAIAEVMNNSEFSKIIRDNFDPASMKSLILFMKLYDDISLKYPSLSTNQKIGIITSFIDDSEKRQILCGEIDRFFNSPSQEKTHQTNYE